MDVFEDIDNFDLYYDYNYSSLLTLNQCFIDTIRNSGGNNIDRLLIVSGANANIDLTCSLSY